MDACRYYTGLIIGALNGVDKATLLAPHYCPIPGYWAAHPLEPAVNAVALGTFHHRTPPQIRGTGYVVQSLEAALWAFAHSADFRTGCLLAANLGEDADTTAAIYGQLAGAYYGVEAIPAEWRAKITFRAEILQLAEKLLLA